MNINDFAPSEPASRFNPVPCLITLCNALCGFTSLVLAVKSYATGAPIPTACIWLLVGSMIFDTLDGLSARLMNAQSLLGAELDSLSDALSFGAAPAAIILASAHRNLHHTPFTPLMIWVAVSFYLCCTLWRLARYNVLSAEKREDTGYFKGLPSPAAASIVCSAVLLLPLLDLNNRLLTAGYIGYTFMAALLMVSRIPYPHARRCVSGEPRMLSFLFIAVVLGSIAVFRIKALVAWAHIYLLAAPLSDWHAKHMSLKTKAVLSFIFRPRRGWKKDP